MPTENFSASQHNLIKKTTLIGNPFYASGRGSTSISFFRSFKSLGVYLGVCDAYSRWNKETIDFEIVAELKNVLLRRPGNFINIYHINAEEVDITLMNLRKELPDDAYNIIYPFWELNKYPDVWIEKLHLFDEIWAPSHFIESAIQTKINKPIYYMPLPVRVEIPRFLNRQYFNIPPFIYTFLFSFDFRSFVERKNPQGLIDVFTKVKKKRPQSEFKIVIKAQGSNHSPRTRMDYDNFVKKINDSSISNDVIFINQLYTDNEMKNLIRCCDCYISLHRAEGFGLGMAEAMFLGKPVVATGYSGNIDFMNEETALIVDFKLISVGIDQYIHTEDQVWAEPDIDQAVFHILKLLDHPEYGYTMGVKASQYIRVNFSYLAMGLRYYQRLEKIVKEKNL